MEAIRSLKMMALDTNDELNLYAHQSGSKNSNLYKANKEKRAYQEFYYRHISKIEDKFCNFNFTLLPSQITQECIYDSQKDTNNFGGRNENDVSNCISLISRVNNIISTSVNTHKRVQFQYLTPFINIF